MTYAEYVVSALSWSTIGFCWGQFISSPGVKLVMRKGLVPQNIQLYHTRRSHRRVK